MAALIADGDQAARNRMVRANIGLVVTIAREFQGRGLALDDLIGEGNLGLIRAAEEFDPDFGTRFSTYASYWVKEAIRDALINTDGHDTSAGPHGETVDQVAEDRADALLRRGPQPDFEEVASAPGPE